jgi:hypothetical protein
VDPDAATGLPDTGPDFQQLETQGVDLCRGQFRSPQMIAHQPKQAVGDGVQEQSKLISQEAVATQTVGLEIQLQLLDAVFYVTPEHVEVVIDELGIAAQVGDYEALIGAQVRIFHLGDNPAGLIPGVRLVAEGSKEALFRPGFLIPLLGLFQQRTGLG